MRSSTIPQPPYLGPRELLNASINAVFTKQELVGISKAFERLIEFPDVSFWEQTIDWNIMSSKTSNVIIRAGQGRYTDKKFVVNWPSAKTFKMRRGAYWFYQGDTSPKDQFAPLCSLIENDLPELGIWIDWEMTFRGKYEGLRNVVALMQLIEKKFPQIPVGMYTGYYFFISNSNLIINASQYKYLKEHSLWLAQYNPKATQLRIPYPWTPKTIELHQYGTPTLGKQYGCQSLEIDMSRVMNHFDLYQPKGVE